MWSILLNASGIKKLVPYAAMLLIAFVALISLYLSGKRSGEQSAQSKRLQDWLNTQHKEAQRRADIQSTRSDVARDRLRQRWTRR